MLFMVFISTATAADSHIYVGCSRVYFTRLTPYETNVNSLFSSLVDSATVTNFNKFEISQTDVVYGLYQCRGDLESSKCKDCVASSVNQLKTTCPLSVGGNIQLDGCFLKYDNTPFFGVQDTVEVLKRCGPSDGYNSDALNSRDDALVNLIAGNGRYFHGGDYGSIRGVAQCVQDLSLSDCQDCLSEASGKLRSQCESSSWGDMFLGKCYIRYHDRDNGHYSNNNRKNDGGGKISKHIKVIIGCLIGALFAGAGVTIIIKINCCTTTNHFLFPAFHKDSVKHKTAEQLAAELAKSVSEQAKAATEYPASLKPEAARKKPEAASLKPEAARKKPEAARKKPEAASVKPEAARVKPEAASVKPEAERKKPEAASVKPEAARKKPEAASVKPEATSKRSKTARTYGGK